MAHIDDLLWRVFQVTQEFMADLDRVEQSGDMEAAGRYIAVMTRHVEPLRRAIEAVEEHEQRAAEAEDRAATAFLGPR